jgi:hypothetical protein
MKAPAKSLILLVLCAGLQVSPAPAARKCPSGEILRVSLGICVPKEQNLSLLQQHPRKAAKPIDDLASPPSEKPAADNRADLVPPAAPTVDIAGDEARAAADKAGAAPTSQAQSSPLSPFGQLFVGAFHSTVSAGLSAFR